MQLVSLLTNKDVLFLMRGKLYRSCVHSCILHGSENKENELTLQQAEMRMIRWMCGIEVPNRFTCSELREILGMDDIIAMVQQHRLRWFGHVLRKDENDWLKNAWILKWKV